VDKSAAGTVVFERQPGTVAFKRSLSQGQGYNDVLQAEPTTLVRSVSTSNTRELQLAPFVGANFSDPP